MRPIRGKGRFCGRMAGKYAIMDGNAPSPYGGKGNEWKKGYDMEKRLNENQRAAVCHEDGPMLVLAGPGSGKTTVLLCRIRRLLERKLARPEEILALTFSRAAADEMRERFRAAHGAEGVHFGTFHSVFFRILRSRYGWGVERVMAEEERRSAVRGILEGMDWDIPDLDEYTTQFLAQASLMKNELAGLAAFRPNGIPPAEFQKLYRAYEGYKERQEKIDFDDMLAECYWLLEKDAEARKFWQGRFRYILVDEFQDVNRAQFACLRILAGAHENLFVVGDDDQSIYGFRGARPDFLLKFREVYFDAAQVTLDTNYRSTGRIIALAEKLIAQNGARFEKNMKGTGEDGQKVTFFLAADPAAEAQRIGEKIAALLDEGAPLGEIAVITRTNLQCGAFARELYRRGIPYELRDGGGNIYEHWVAKDLLAYLLLAENEEADNALRRILNKPKRYISKDLLAEAEKMPYTLLRSLFVCPSLKKWQEQQLEKLREDLAHIRKKTPGDGLKYVRKVIGYDEYLEEYAAYRRTSAQTLWEIADEMTEIAKTAVDAAAFRAALEEMGRQMKERPKAGRQERNGVLLTTMHGAKGLEFREVFLPTLVEGVMPHEKGVSAGELEEERRLFYVAMTRAKEHLCLSAVRSRYEKETEPSRFLGELGLDTASIFQKKIKKS